MNTYRLRNGIIAIIIGLFILSRILHVPIPFISTLSFFNLFVLIGLIYFITGIYIRKEDENDKKPTSLDVPTHQQEEHDSTIEPNWVLQHHVESIKQQYEQYSNTFAPMMQAAIINEQLYESDKMKHANFFYSILKAYPKVEAMWTEKLDGTVIASVPSADQITVLPLDAKQLVKQNKTYITPLDDLFGEANFIQTIAVPIVNEVYEVIGCMVIQIKCI